MPKIGPFKVLSFKAPTAEVEKLFLDSFQQARTRFRASLESIASQGAARLTLPNTDFDTGRPAARGEYQLADDTYAELLDTLAKRQFARIPDSLRANITKYYQSAPPLAHETRQDRKRDARVRQQLATLTAASTTSQRR
jgi:hypothetical protein